MSNCFVGVSDCFVDASNCFVGEFCSVDVRFNSFGTYPDVLPYFNYIRNMFDWEEVSLSWFIMNLFILVTYIRLNFKIIEKIPGILVINGSNGNPFLLFLVWHFGTKIQIGSHPLT